MRKSIVFGLTLAALTCAGSATANETQISSNLINNKAETIGTVKVKAAGTGVLLELKAIMLPPGSHGFHMHKIADCSDLATFKSTGGHVNQGKERHGFLNHDGHHDGDLPNLLVGKDGKAQLEIYIPRISLSSGSSNLLDEDGSALILHAQPDDYSAQPIGGAGKRIACSELK